MENSVVGLSSAAARDKLVKALGRQKDKKAQLALEGVAIDATASAAIMAEATQKNCAYVVQTKLTETHEQGNVSGRAGNASNVPEYSATIDYKLFRVSDGSTVGSGSAKATDVGSAAEIVAQALDHVAGKVLADIKKVPAS
jgi:formiminotetrahydrofolate cyclodeaminase